MSLSLSIGLSLGSPILSQGSGVAYEAEATALFARMTIQPDATRKGQINTLVLAMKTGGIWAKLDAFYVMAAHDAQAARQNWIADLFNLTAVSSPSFTADRGFTGNGTTSYLSTSYDPALVGGHLKTNDHDFGIWLLARDILSAVDIGNALLSINPRGLPDGVIGARSSSATSISAVTTGSTGVGLTSVRRTASDQFGIYRNGALFENITGASTALTSSELFLLGRNNGGLVSPSTGQIAVAYGGAAFTDAELTSFHSAIQTYLQQVGAV